MPRRGSSRERAKKKAKSSSRRQEEDAETREQQERAKQKAKSSSRRQEEDAETWEQQERVNKKAKSNSWERDSMGYLYRRPLMVRTCFFVRRCVCFSLCFELVVIVRLTPLGCWHKALFLCLL